ncbi:MAG: hypothetical protein JWQ89_4027 [Devosia sp.]|uniref:endonuclease domain-containing protein n=1 Tax=Devosia sp. TaxID=1871048 RepID=UPI002A6FBE04|nr:hypothetical protein [Devosia sp.]
MGVSLSIERARKLRRDQTGPERAMWRILWHFREQGWHFRRQQQVGPYYADFACLHAKVIVEMDGETHGTDRAVAYDANRNEYMRGRGIHVLRFTNDYVLQNADGVYEVIAGVLGAVSRVSNSPHPVPPPQGGRRPLRSAIATTPFEQTAEPDTAHAAPSSPSPLRGGDRGGGS